MTRDDIIRMMQSACDTDKVDAWHNEFWTVTQDELERFTALATAEKNKEIERLRKVLKKLEYFSDGTIRRYPTESEVEAARQEQPR